MGRDFRKTSGGIRNASGIVAWPLGNSCDFRVRASALKNPPYFYIQQAHNNQLDKKNQSRLIAKLI
jgi:hypothetical protein